MILQGNIIIGMRCYREIPLLGYDVTSKYNYWDVLLQGNTIIRIWCYIEILLLGCVVIGHNCTMWQHKDWPNSLLIFRGGLATNISTAGDNVTTRQYSNVLKATKLKYESKWNFDASFSSVMWQGGSQNVATIVACVPTSGLFISTWLSILKS